MKMRMRTVTSLLALAGATLTPLAAHATGVAAASPTGKGIVGGALLGAEVVMTGEAIFKVQPTWAYIAGGVAGGIGGGVGGYFVEHGTSDARGPMLMLAGGVAFAIPSLVYVLATTAYQPPASYLEDQAPLDEPTAEPPAPSEAAPPPVTPAPAPAAAPPAATPDAPAPATEPAPAPTGRRTVPTPRRLSLKLPPPALFGIRDSRLALGIPNVALLHAYSRTERIMFNAPDVTEVRIPVLDVSF